MKPTSQKRMRAFYYALYDPKNWSLNFSEVSRQTGIPISTIFEKVKKFKKNGQILIEIKLIPEWEVL